MSGEQLAPTPTRLRFARSIAAGHVRCYHFITPACVDMATDQVVTTRVEDMVRVELAAVPPRVPDTEYSIVSLTPAGEEWLKTYGGNE